MTFAKGGPLLSETIGVVLPPPDDALVLQLCLLDRERVTTSWGGWIAGDANLKAKVEKRPSLKRLLPLLYFSLVKSEVSIDPVSLAALRAATLWEEKRAVRVREILTNVIRAVSHRSVTPVLLNGVAFAEMAYPRPSLRHCHGIDLLVRSADLTRVRSALLECGIIPNTARAKSPLGFVHAEGLPINLHVGLLEASLFSIPTADIFARLISVSIDGTPAKTLCQMDMLLHLCGRLASGMVRDPASSVADAAMIIRRGNSDREDWDMLAATADQSGLSLPLFVMLSYLQKEFELAIPDDVITRISEQASRSGARYRDAVLAGVRKRHGLGAMIRRSGWRSRFEIARWLAVPSRPFLNAWCAERGLRSTPSWYILRPLRRAAIKFARLRPLHPIDKSRDKRNGLRL